MAPNFSPFLYAHPVVQSTLHTSLIFLPAKKKLHSFRFSREREKILGTQGYGMEKN